MLTRLIQYLFLLSLEGILSVKSKKEKMSEAKWILCMVRFPSNGTETISTDKKLNPQTKDIECTYDQDEYRQH